MKVLRIIKKIPSLKHATTNNKTKKYTNSKSKQSGLYFSTIRPELIELMQSLGLVQQNMNCNNCDANLRWSPEECVDLMTWKCPVCYKGLQTNGDNCSFKEVLWILLAWLNNEDVVDVSERLGLKKVTIHQLYHLAGKTVEKNIRSNIPQWHLGGPGVIVLIDTFPDGCTNTTTSSDRPILCLAELKGLPPTMWFEALEPNNNQETKQWNRMKCLGVVQQIVQPGSIVIARRDSKLCSYDDLVGIQHKFQTVVSIEALAKHNSEEQNLYDNLNIIWKETLDVCTAAQYYHHSLMQSFLFCYMWRRKFRKENYPQLLNEISSFIE